VSDKMMGRDITLHNKKPTGSGDDKATLAPMGSTLNEGTTPLTMKKLNKPNE